MLHKKRFVDCKNKKPLQFDFYLPDYNICIEYDGIQHYEEVKRFGGKSGLEYRQMNDKIKTIYCENNNIRLLRISYKDELDSVYLDKLVIINKFI